jgi:hypothetical protein
MKKTPSLTVTVANDRQLENASGPMLTTEPGIVTFVIECRTENAFCPIVDKLGGSSRLVREVQPTRAESPMLVTDGGIFKVTMELHSAKASVPIAVTGTPAISAGICTIPVAVFGYAVMVISPLDSVYVKRPN